jgi:hypothetical protein
LRQPCGAEIASVFRDSHNRPLEIALASSLTARHLRRFPRFHSVHHNNKGDWVQEMVLRNLSVLKICDDDFVVDETLFSHGLILRPRPKEPR